MIDRYPATFALTLVCFWLSLVMYMAQNVL